MGIPCAVDSCDRIAVIRGWCRKHYARWLTHGDPTKTLYHMDEKPECSVESCHRRGISTGVRRDARVGNDLGPLCEKHYQRVLRGEGLTDRHERGEPIYIDGYLYVKAPDHPDARANGYIAQHRLVMEQHIGRRLLPEETVHHTHGVRDDNRIEHLELWSCAQPSGQRVADKLAWAKQMIALYEPIEAAISPG